MADVRESQLRRKGLFNGKPDTMITQSAITIPPRDAKGKSKGKYRHTMLHTKGQFTNPTEAESHERSNPHEWIVKQNYEIQEHDPAPPWFATEGHGTTTRQTRNGITKGEKRGTKPPKNIHVIAYNQDTADAYSHAGRMSTRFGLEFPLLATKSICVEPRSASLVKLDAMLSVKCHYNDDDLNNNQWYLAPVFTATGVILVHMWMEQM